MNTPTNRSAVVAFALLIALTSCAKSPTTVPGEAGDSAASKILVSAAASTRDVLEKLAAEFAAESQVAVKINPGPSNSLANQILSGAPADLFLSANAQWADEVEKAGLAEASVRLVTNKLVIVVPTANPGGVHGPGDLANAKVTKIALAGEQVPAGMYADQALAKLDLLGPLTDAGKIVRGADVRSALGYVEQGEAEAGIVYSTDVRVAAGVEIAYEFDPRLHDEIVYVLVLLKHGNRTSAAREFYEFLASPAADAVYGQFGFARIGAAANAAEPAPTQ